MRVTEEDRPTEESGPRGRTEGPRLDFLKKKNLPKPWRLYLFALLLVVVSICIDWRYFEDGHTRPGPVGRLVWVVGLALGLVASKRYAVNMGWPLSLTKPVMTVLSLMVIAGSFSLFFIISHMVSFAALYVLLNCLGG